MKEITIRIYDGDDKEIISPVQTRSKYRFFDLYIDGEAYYNMKHLVLDICAPQIDERGVLNLDDTSVTITIEKDFRLS